MFKLIFVTLALVVTGAAQGRASPPVLLASAADVRDDGNAGGRTGFLALGSDGSLYGTAEFGGSHRLGEVYRLTPPTRAGGSWDRTTVFSFPGGAIGSHPIGGVVIDQRGILFGATAGNELGVAGINLPGHSSGAQSGSVVYALKPQGSGYRIKVLANLGYFSASGGLVRDAKGSLYGVTQRSANASTGQVFRLSPPTVTHPEWLFTTLYDFSNSDMGSDPTGGVTLGSGGALYGVAARGGDTSCHDGKGCGTLFKLTPSANTPWAIDVLQVFHGGSAGDRPAGPVLVDNNGNVLGVTTFGGVASTVCTEGCGTIYSVAARGGLRIIHSFCGTRATMRAGCSDGMAPAAGLVRARNGQFYGTAALGGSTQQGGTVFRVDAFGSFSVVAALAASLGGEPASPLADTGTDLVGTTGGTTGRVASVFAVTP